jgi:hypothetical protein
MGDIAQSAKSASDDVAAAAGDLAGDRARSAVGLLTSAGFVAAAASFLTDLSVTDVVAATGGLAVAGVVFAGSSAVQVLVRRRALAAKVEALEELRHEIGEPGVGASDEALRPVYEKIDARTKELEQRITRMGWRQGAVYAVFGAAVAVLVVVFGHYLPVIK